MLKNMKKHNHAGDTLWSATGHYLSTITIKHQTEPYLNRKTLYAESPPGYCQYSDTNEKYFNGNSTLKCVAGICLRTG